jgi:hypothetical protein
VTLRVEFLSGEPSLLGANSVRSANDVQLEEPGACRPSLQQAPDYKDIKIVVNAVESTAFGIDGKYA